MRRDQFTVAVSHVDSGPEADPTLTIEYGGPGERLSDQFADTGGDRVGAGDIDAAFRLQDPLDASDPTGVISLTHRITGEYLLEANATVEDVLGLIEAVRERDEEDASFRVRIQGDGEPLVYELDALFVYDEEGSLRRGNSLIPSGVEL